MNPGTLVALALVVAPVEPAKPVVENAQVAVWDVTWNGASTATRFDRDTIIVYLGSGTLETTGSDGVVQVAARKPGDVEFVPKGAARRRRVSSGESVRAILVEYRGASPPALANTSGLPDAFDRPGIVNVLQNADVNVWRYSWEPGKRTPMHFHARDVVVVFLADGVLRSTTPDGKSVLNPHTFGFSKFSPRGRIHYEELAEGQATAVLIELKSG
ncbi:MAG TPA: hypothetical protein VEJ89_16135 [Myxococcaceae bacterium]|nr:hypothetical protein [Myxococcaceae bacterium]